MEEAKVVMRHHFWAAVGAFLTLVAEGNLFAARFLNFAEREKIGGN